MSILVVIGAGIIILLGVVHAVFTLRSSPDGGPMTPIDPAVQEAMQLRGGLGLAPTVDTSLYRAWTGFNLSHALGATAIGLFVAIPALADFEAALDQAWWPALALVLPPLYLTLSIRYWFSGPTRGISMATALITVGIVGGLAT